MTKEEIFFSLKRFNALQFYYNFYRFTTTMLFVRACFVPSVSAIACPSPTQPNNFNLSEREKEILSYLVKGMSYKMIAAACFISIDTVRGHISNIYKKLHVHSKGEAIETAIKDKIV